MTKQPEAIRVLKHAFFDHFAARLSVRAAPASFDQTYIVTLPASRNESGYSPAELIRFGAWLEGMGWIAYDERRPGKLSGPSGWTLWNGGRSTYVRALK